jgi:hypothetical protein
VDHRQLRLARRLPGPVGPRPGQRLRGQRPLQRPGLHGRSTSPRATSGPATTAAPRRRDRRSPTRRSWTACAPAGSGSTTAGLIKASTPGSGWRATAGPPRVRRSAASCTSARHAVELTLEIDLAERPNWAQFVPVLARVDVIVGAVTGPVSGQGHLRGAEHQGRQVVRGRRAPGKLSRSPTSWAAARQAVLRAPARHRRQPHPARPDGRGGRPGGPEAGRDRRRRPVGRPVVLHQPDLGPPPVHTQDHVRPEWREGQLVLALVPAAGNTLAPFEVPNPTPCCADHP